MKGEHFFFNPLSILLLARLSILLIDTQGAQFYDWFFNSSALKYVSPPNPNVGDMKTVLMSV